MGAAQVHSLLELLVKRPGWQSRPADDDAGLHVERQARFHCHVSFPLPKVSLSFPSGASEQGVTLSCLG